MTPFADVKMLVWEPVREKSKENPEPGDSWNSERKYELSLKSYPTMLLILPKNMETTERHRKRNGLGTRRHRLCFFTASRATLEKSFLIPEPQFSHPQNGNNSSTTKGFMKIKSNNACKLPGTGLAHCKSFIIIEPSFTEYLPGALQAHF